MSFLSTIQLKYQSLESIRQILLLSVKNADEKRKVLKLWNRYANKYHTTQTLITTFNLDSDLKDLRETFIRWKWQGKVNAIPLDAEEIYYKRINNPLHPWYYIKASRKFLRRPTTTGCAKIIAIVVAITGIILNDRFISWIKDILGRLF